MHEFSLATQIVESVTEFVRSEPCGREVSKVRLLVGELVGIETAQLRFCYNSITRETSLAHSVLEITPALALVRCPNCHYQGSPRYLNGSLARAKIPTLLCPRCGRSAEATQGHECELMSVQFAAAKSAAVAQVT